MAEDALIEVSDGWYFIKAQTRLYGDDNKNLTVGILLSQGANCASSIDIMQVLWIRRQETLTIGARMTSRNYTNTLQPTVSSPCRQFCCGRI